MAKESDLMAGSAKQMKPAKVKAPPKQQPQKDGLAKYAKTLRAGKFK
jgi:hypothetical protein